MAPKLYSAFLEHSGTLDFIKWMEDNDDGGCFIIVMVENAVTMTKIQAALTADLEANKVLPIV